ncbi:MAG: DsbA family protein [Chloroflexi bacterium]|nr:DsbA family protein [Chloroflexota bacterium]
MRLEKVEDRFRERVELRWRSYALLMGRMEARAVTPHSRTSRAAASKAEPEAPFQAWEESKPYVTSSLPALEAAKCASLQGEEAFAAYHRALFRGLFVESRDISDAEVLVAMAKEQGLDADRFRGDLEASRQRVVVIGEHLEMLSEYGEAASGVPLVIIGGRDPIVGAAPSDLYIRIIERVLEEERSSPDA